MSGFVQGLVWMTRGLGEAGTVSESSVKAVAARIADAASDEGAGLRPMALAYLADDTGLKERQVQRALARLRDAGILSVDEGTGRGRGKAALYQLNLDRLSAFIPLEKLPPGLRARVVEACRTEAGDGPESGVGENTSNCRVLPDGKTRQQNGENTSVATRKDVSTDTHYVSTTKTTKGAGARAAGHKRRRAPDAHAQADAPVVEPTVADLDIPGGAEGSVIRAALNGWQKPASVRPWIGKFRVVDASEGTEPDWQLAVDGNEDDFRRVFTGAAIHLGLIRQGAMLRTWSMAFAEIRIGKGRAHWAGHDPWDVALKPEVASGRGPPGADAETSETETPQGPTDTNRQDAA